MKKYWIILCLNFLILNPAQGLYINTNNNLYTKGELFKLSGRSSHENYDLYIAIHFPEPDNRLFFIQKNRFSEQAIPYIRSPEFLNSDSVQLLLELELTQDLPNGKYEILAAEMTKDKFSLKDINNKIERSFFELTGTEIRTNQNQNEDNEEEEYSNIYLGESYQTQLKPLNGKAPYQFEIVSGKLPQGLSLNIQTGVIEGIPKETEKTFSRIKITDSQGDFGYTQIRIKVFEILNFGKASDYKSCDDFVKIFTSVKKYAEIRIQQGTYFCHNLDLNSYLNSNTSEDIYILGGWDKSFKIQTKDPKLTIFDAEQKGRIFSLQYYHEIQISYLTFQNGLSESSGGAISNDSHGTKVDHCRFIKNKVIHKDIIISNGISNGGGALFGIDVIENSYFYKNEAPIAGAIFSCSVIKNSEFVENKADIAGAVLAVLIVSEIGIFPTTITNSLFNGNIATQAGGAVVTYFGFIGIHNTFVNNQATLFCGALCGIDTATIVLNSIFYNNIANQHPNDIEQITTTNTFVSSFAEYFVLNIDYSLVNYINTAPDNDFFNFLKVFKFEPKEVYRSQVTLGAHLIRDNPLFVDIEMDNYNLSPNSPALDRATTTIPPLFENIEFFNDTFLTEFLLNTLNNTPLQPNLGIHKK